MSKEASIEKTNAVVVNKDDEKRRKKEYREQRRNKRNRRIARGRRIKNFIFFLVGFFTSLILLFGGIFIGIKFIPLNTFVPDEVIKEDTMGAKSLLDAVSNIDDYGMEDVPFVYDLFSSILNSTGAVWLDEDEFRKLRFDDGFGDGFMNCLHIDKGFFGELGSLEIFSTIPVPETENPENPEITEFNPKLYYVVDSGSHEEGTANYVRAYTDNCERVQDTKGKSLYYLALDEMSVGVLGEVFDDRFELMKVKDIMSVLGNVEENSDIVEILGDNRIKDMSTFSADDIALSKVIDVPTEENDFKNKQIYDILLDAVSYDEETDTYDETLTYEDLLIGDLSKEGFSIDNVALSSVIDMPTEENEFKNQKLYDILLDAASYDKETNDYDNTITYADLKISDLSNGFDMDYVRLYNVIELPTEENGYKNKKLYDVLLDATSFDPTTETYDETKTYSDIKILDLSSENFSIDNVRICKVMEVDPDNPNLILDKLIEDETVNIGNLSNKINEMRLDEIYDEEIFTTDASSENVRDTNARYSYDEATGVYTLNKTNGNYYLSAKARVWIFMFYEVGEHDADGYALTYTNKNVTFSGLEEDVGDVSGGVMNATVRQLYLSGIINTRYDNIMAMTPEEVMESLDNAIAP